MNGFPNRRVGHNPNRTWYIPQNEEERVRFQQAKEEVKNFLLVNKDGVTIHRIFSFFQEHGVDIPLGRFGLNFNEFIFHCQDFLQVRKMNPDYFGHSKRLLLFLSSSAVDDKKRHLLDFVQGQLSDKKKNGQPRPTLRNTVFCPPCHLLDVPAPYLFDKSVPCPSPPRRGGFGQTRGRPSTRFVPPRLNGQSQRVFNPAWNYDAVDSRPAHLLAARLQESGVASGARSYATPLASINTYGNEGPPVLRNPPPRPPSSSSSSSSFYETDSDTEPETKPEPIPVPKPEPKTEPNPEPKTEPNPEQKTQPTPEPQPGTGAPVVRRELPSLFVRMHPEVVRPTPSQTTQPLVVQTPPAPTIQSEVVQDPPTVTIQRQVFRPSPTPTHQPQVVRSTPAPTSQPQAVRPPPTPTHQPLVVRSTPAPTSQPQAVRPSTTQTDQPQVVRSTPTPTSQPQAVRPSTTQTTQSNGLSEPGLPTVTIPRPVVRSLFSPRTQPQALRSMPTPTSQPQVVQDPPTATIQRQTVTALPAQTTQPHAVRSVATTKTQPEVVRPVPTPTTLPLIVPSGAPAPTADTEPRVARLRSTSTIHQHVIRSLSIPTTQPQVLRPPPTAVTQPRSSPTPAVQSHLVRPSPAPVTQPEAVRPTPTSTVQSQVVRPQSTPVTQPEVVRSVPTAPIPEVQPAQNVNVKVPNQYMHPLTGSHTEDLNILLGNINPVDGEGSAVSCDSFRTITITGFKADAPAAQFYIKMKEVKLKQGNGVEKIENMMNMYYNFQKADDVHVKKEGTLLHGIYAGKDHKTNKWRRIQVTEVRESVSDGQKPVTVFLVDHGHFIDLDYFDLRYLTPFYWNGVMRVAFQASFAYLPHEPGMPKLASNMFMRLSVGRDFLCSINGIEWKGNVPHLKIRLIKALDINQKVGSGKGKVNPFGYTF